MVLNYILVGCPWSIESIMLTIEEFTCQALNHELFWWTVSRGFYRHVNVGEKEQNNVNSWKNSLHKKFPLREEKRPGDRYQPITTTYYIKNSSCRRGALGFSVLRFWLFFRSVFRFLLQKTSVFRFWWSLRFADFSLFSIWFSVFVKNTSGFSVLVPDVIFGFWKGSEVQ